MAAFSRDNVRVLLLEIAPGPWVAAPQALAAISILIEPKSVRS
jgi:hypothetical protein